MKLSYTYNYTTVEGEAKSKLVLSDVIKTKNGYFVKANRAMPIDWLVTTGAITNFTLISNDYHGEDKELVHYIYNLRK